MVPAPYVALQSTIVQKAGVKAKVVPCPGGGVVALQPTPQQKEKIEKKLGGTIPEGLLLSAVDLKKLPYGGTATVTLPPPDANGNPQAAVVKIFPNKQPFWEWKTSDRDLSVWLGYGGDTTSGFTAGRLLGAELRQGLFRVGPAEVEARSGLVHSFGGNTLWWVGVGARVRF